MDRASRPRSGAFLASCAIVLLSSIPIFASNVSVGDFRVDPASGLGSDYFTSGHVVWATPYTELVASASYPLTGAYTGRMDSQIWKNPETNELAFNYKLTIDSIVQTPPWTRPPTPARSLTIGGDWSRIVVYEVGASTLNPNTTVGDGLSSQEKPTDWTDGHPAVIARQTFEGYGAPSVMWSAIFGNGTFLYPGNYSSWFWYATNATSYTVSTVGVLDSGRTADSFALIPVPEPATLVMLALGTLMLRRRKA